MANFILISCIVLCVWCVHVSCGTLNDTQTLLSNLLANYDVNVRPVENQDDAVQVSTLMYVKSIQDFDEVKEMFSFVGALYVTWNDVSMTWNPADYGGVWQITVSYKNVWIPELILSTPSDDVESLGSIWNRVRFYSNGQATWLPADLIKSTCAVNVRNYPYDIQSCLTSFNCLGYSSEEVTLIPISTKLNTDIYQGNSLWDLTDTNVSVANTAGGSQLNLLFYLKRKPSFVIINVILPILFLSLLNILVFVLVPESGERVSYCITVLLAIAVFMTIVSELLPKSSEPVPIISYKLTTDVVSSSLIVLITILNLRIYHKDDREPVPRWLIAIYRTLSCRRCCVKKKDADITVVYPFVDTTRSQYSERKTKISTVTPSLGNSKVKDVDTDVNDSEHSADDDIVTWKEISFMFDWIALIFFTLVSFLGFGIFLATTASEAD